MEGLAPKEGGDSIFMQSQMTPIQFLPIANGGKQNAGTN
jgi:hypothetical protein